MREKLQNIFGVFGENVTVETLSGELYKVHTEKHGDYFICAKDVTFGGRENLEYEQRIQVKGDSNNYIETELNRGNHGALLGILEDDRGNIVICAFKVKHSNAIKTISKQIKNNTIREALVNGFAQQAKGEEFACAFRKEFLYFYLSNIDWIHDNKTNALNEQSRVEDASAEQQSAGVGANVLFYGVPGAGKSHEIDSIIVQSRTERIVFHPDYTYSDFVGLILPRVDKEGKLRYVFEPGPFTKILRKAYDDPGNMYFLVIEEINRGNAPAIFGDIFQLLDRNEDGSGKYYISNYDIAKIVYGEGHEDKVIKMPGNLSLLATMNTSDQNVFTLDTAFQRRWQMHLVRNDISRAEHAESQIEESRIPWGIFATKTNEEIIEYGKETGSAEDKRLGAYFARTDELSRDKFPEKVLKYLWDDVFRMDHYVYFNESISSIDGIIEAFREPQSESDALKRVLKASVYKKMSEQITLSEAVIDEDQDLEEHSDGE